MNKIHAEELRALAKQAFEDLGGTFDDGDTWDDKVLRVETIGRALEHYWKLKVARK